MSVVSEEKEHSGRSQIFHFKSSEKKNSVVSAVTGEKELSKLTSIFHFNGSENKTA